MILCECGCGQEAPLATKNHTSRGYVIGQPLRFKRNHKNRWSGKGRFINSGGYVLVRLPLDNPFASMGRVKKCAVSVYVPEHRITMAKSLGRCLLEEEQVHHRNGVRHDNRLENLELWTTQHPKGQRVADLLSWAHEIIALYEGLGEL